MLWVDRYRPRTMDQLSYHEDLAQSLKSMVDRGDFPHILFYGPSGAGKKTRVLALLREIYGPGVEKVKVEHKEFKVGSTKIEVPILTSAHHLELNPGDAGNRDRDVVQELIKEIAQSAPLPTSSSGDAADWKPFKVIVLNEVDNLSKDAQHALRRTMEKYITTCRIMMTCSNACRVIAPIRSRCLCVRIAAPSVAQICSVLQATARCEGLSLPEPLAEKLATQAHGNVRKALLMLEAAKVAKYPFDPIQELRQADWEQYIDNIATECLREQSPRKLGEIRNRLYDLLANCIPPDLIMETLVRSLLSKQALKSEPKLQMQVLSTAALYEHRMISGSKAIFHLEAFVAKFMAIYKTHMIAVLGG